MDRCELKRKSKRLSELAESIPVTKRLWVFGSRCKNAHHPNSDLDIAVEVEWVQAQLLGACENHFALWCATLPKFEDAMTAGCPWPIDLQCYAPAVNTPCLHQYLQEASAMICKKLNK